MSRKKEPVRDQVAPVDVSKLKFGEWAICPKCRAKIRERACKECGGTGVVPNKGIIPFTKPVGGD
jgi:DnaJ-class molecular chaperone